jgi:hypothetical protein
MCSKFQCVSIYSQVKNIMDLFGLEINSCIEAPCVYGDADRIRSVNYETILNLQIFFLFGPISFHATKIWCTNKLTHYIL